MPESISIDRLWQGTSGQAPWQRKQGTVKEAKNVRFDIRAGGATKRSATEFIAALVPHVNSVMDPSDSFLWTNIQGAIVAIGIGGRSSSDCVLGWKADGTPLHVVDFDDGPIAGGELDTYLEGIADPIRDLDVTSKFDTLIVTNRTQAMGPSKRRAFTFDESFAYLVLGDPEASGVSADWANDDLHKALYFSELPDDKADGYVIYVENDENLDPLGYYIFFPPDEDGSRTHESFPEGFFPQHGDWFRIPDGRDSATWMAAYKTELMPHRIVLDEANGKLVVGPCPWTHRLSGNSSTVKRLPWASAGYHIQSVEFFAGRLFLFSEEHVTSSIHNNFFNLWVDNVNAMTDTDRIAQDVTHTQMGRVLRAAAVGRGLLMVADHGQLEFSSGSENLTNLNGRVHTVTSFPSHDIKPSAAGPMVAIWDLYGDAHLFAWQQAEMGPSLFYQALLTAHEPTRFADYEVKGQHLTGMTLISWVADRDPKIIGIEQNLTESDTISTEIHEGFIIQGSLVQSAWSAMEMIDQAVLVHSWGTAIRIVVKQEGSDSNYALLHYQNRAPRVPANMLYQPRLDYLELVPASEMTYDLDLDETTIPHSGREGDADRSYIVNATEDLRHEFRKVKRLDDNGDPVFAGDIGAVDSNGDCTEDQYLGFIFDSELTLFELYPGLTSIGIRAERLVIFHYETTDYTVVFLPTPQSDEYKEFFQAHRVGLAKVGQPSFETSWKEIGIECDPREASIKIQSSSPGQYVITGLEYAVHQEGRGKR